MRRILVRTNKNPPSHVGDLILYDNISDDEVKDCTVTWVLYLSNGQLFEMVLVPKLKPVGIPMKPEEETSIQIKNWLHFWMEGNLPPGIIISTEFVNQLYNDLVAAQYKIIKE